MRAVNDRPLFLLQHRKHRQDRNARQTQHTGHQHGDGVDGEENPRKARDTVQKPQAHEAAGAVNGDFEAQLQGHQQQPDEHDG